LGIYYTSYAIIGVKVDLKKFTEVVKGTSCNHSEQEGHPFCPVCGKRVTNHSETRWTDEWDAFSNRMDETPKHYYYISNNEDHDYGYFGYGSSSDRDEGETKAEIPDISEIKGVIESILTEWGLWDEKTEKTFAFYSITDGR